MSPDSSKKVAPAVDESLDDAVSVPRQHFSDKTKARFEQLKIRRQERIAKKALMISATEKGKRNVIHCI